MKKKPTQITGILSILLIFLVSALIIGYVLRNKILSVYLSDKIRQIEQQYPVKITYGQVFVDGLTKLAISDFSLTTLKSDTLLSVRHLNAQLAFRELLTGKPELKNLKIDGMTMKLPENHDKFFDFSAKKDQKDEPMENGKKTAAYNERLSRFISFFYRLFPENIHISGLRIEIEKTLLYLPDLKIEDSVFHIPVFLTENGEKQHFVMDGLLRRRDKRFECKMYAPNHNKTELPFLKYKYDTELAFDTLAFNFYPLLDNSKQLQLGGELSFFNLNVKNEKLSTKDMLLDNSRIDYLLNVYADCIELDSASVVRFNKLCVHPYLSFKKKPHPRLTVSVNKSKFAADDLFASFPKGLFHNLDGLKTSGDLSFEFSFSVDMEHVDSLTFYSSLDKNNFKIHEFGNSDFREISQPFFYTAYEDGKEVKSFMVDESYEHFRAIDRISPYLKAAVLFTEDGSFYSHNGFVDEALRTSIVKNIKEKRFARGGSTISMQLVKNLYLNRNKTVMRKLEEALIVWLIENNRLVSKDRMLEVYLNIIEWGPQVYGANEASRFYFNKDAGDLTPAEAIYMASIISRPKKFMWFFDKNRELKPFLAHFYQVVGKRMLKHGYITEEQFQNLLPTVEIRGEASAFLAKIDGTVFSDSEEMEKNSEQDDFNRNMDDKEQLYNDRLFNQPEIEREEN